MGTTPSDMMTGKGGKEGLRTPTRGCKVRGGYVKITRLTFMINPMYDDS